MLVSDGRVAGYVRGPEDREPPDLIERGDDTSPAVPKKVGFLRKLFGRK